MDEFQRLYVSYTQRILDMCQKLDNTCQLMVMILNNKNMNENETDNIYIIKSLKVLFILPALTKPNR